MGNIMKKTKFKCDSCKVTVKRSPDKIITNRGKRYCSANCKGKDHG